MTADEMCLAGCSAALGMYELPLAYMVIAHSQRDPGEFLLELQGFAVKPSPALQRHAIDAHLGRWPRALRHLMEAGEQHFEAVLKLAKDKACRWIVSRPIHSASADVLFVGRLIVMRHAAQRLCCIIIGLAQTTTFCVCCRESLDSLYT